jgi:glycosyltransferase involved in cell wall biosynthesis
MKARSDRPAVSVIVPTFNRAHVLRRAIESVLSQDFTDFELLVIDDGSTDATAELVDDYIRGDLRVRSLVHPRNAGVSAARNLGLREANGELIAFLDSDDEWLPGKLRRQVDYFDSAPRGVGLLYGAVHTLGAESWTFHPVHRGMIYFILLDHNVIHGTSGVMLRRDVVDRVGGFADMPAIEDWDYWIRAARCFLVDFLPDPQIRYYASPDDAQRKTRNLRQNLNARAVLYRNHGEEMRRARTAHRFLAESARRHLGAGEPVHASALALQALRHGPLALANYRLLARTLMRRFIPPLSARRHPQAG